MGVIPGSGRKNLSKSCHLCVLASPIQCVFNVAMVFIRYAPQSRAWTGKRRGDIQKRISTLQKSCSCNVKVYKASVKLRCKSRVVQIRKRIPQCKNIKMSTVRYSHVTPVLPVHVRITLTPRVATKWRLISTLNINSKV